MRTNALLSWVLVGSASLACAGTAAAAPRVTGGFDEGGYVYGSPGILAIHIGEEDIADNLDPTWQWGVGGGWMFTPTRLFKIAVGGAFEHTIYNIEDDGFFVSGPISAAGDVDGNMIRFVPEVRLGAGNNRVWGYGLVGTGLAVSIIDWEAQVAGISTEGDDTDVGFDLQLGAGAQGIVWSNLMIGGELDFDLGFMTNDDDGDEGECVPLCDNDYGVHTLGIKLIVGWYF